MQFLDSVTVDSENNKVIVKYKSGLVSNDADIAKFFLCMQDKSADIEVVNSYISMGKRIDPGHDWQEEEKVLKSFSCQG